MKTTASFLTAVLAASSLTAATLEMKPDTYLNMNYAHRHGRHKVLELGDSSAILSASRHAAGFALLASDRDGDGELTVKFRLLFPDGSVQPLGDAVPVKLRKDRMLARNLVLTLDNADIARLMKSESKFNLVPVRVQAEFTGSDGKPLPALNDVAAIGFDRGLKPQSPEVSVAENGVTGGPTLAINGNLYPAASAMSAGTRAPPGAPSGSGAKPAAICTKSYSSRGASGRRANSTTRHSSAPSTHRSPRSSLRTRKH